MQSIISKLFLFILLITLTGAKVSYSQLSLTPGDFKTDTAKNKKEVKLNDFGLSEAKSPADWIQKSGIVISDLFIKSVQKMDTAKWSADFDDLEKQIQKITLDVLLVSTADISLKEIKDFESRANGMKKKLDGYADYLQKVVSVLIGRYDVASEISRESFNKVAGNDTAIQAVFKEELDLLVQSSDELKSAIIIQIKNAASKEKRRIELSFALAFVLELLNEKTDMWQEKVMVQNQPHLWNISGKDYPDFGTVFQNSFNFVYNSTVNYFRIVWVPSLMIKLLTVAVFVGVLFYFRNFRLRKKLDEYKEIDLKYINEFPWLVVTLVILTLIQFVFDYPPIILKQIILLIIMLIVSYIIFRKYIEKKYIPAYSVLFAYYILVKINDFILSASVYERIFYFLGIIPAVLMFMALISYSKKPFANQVFVTSLITFLILHLLTGFAGNLLGYVTLSKL
ncbi:MAG: hypothetical protein L0Y76_02355, partial [Ignavibacteria bacterium]|nr:hypothetical protein [Ignavibacteria bacterium]